MKNNRNKYSLIEICPIRNVVARFGNKWSLLVIMILSEQKAPRFSELCKLIPDISPKVLSETLKTLEADGLVTRTVYPVVPPKVEYSLTEIGHSLVPLITQLTEWAQKNMKSIIECRENHEKNKE
ncbi:MAG: helix-turn-helix transcriptional regulator [Bacteroidales bacterium]|nr:helix-turn-helix transcriptional regulator [Bacteroidales bacterium]MCM1147365.1 helix-turn-helix transcriptional regulator [Bacteroidales bacterium]MCM1206199.1 helix-turn-helix transcriptional regulator [Bacillota bacterium]MCM1510433.1 helix-turn-helix transcriptional regulator [Clostridium sp.]